jgi:putative DNA primase/helicase
VALPRHIADIPTPDDEDLRLEAIVAQLARCSAARYKRLRHAYAEEVGLRVGDLDELVRNQRRGLDRDSGEGLPIVLYEPIPCDTAVDGVGILDRIVTALGKYLVLPVTALRAIALWVLFAHCFGIAERAPKLLIKSAEKRSGKTLLLRLVGYLVPRAKLSSNISPAATFRLITAHRIVLLIDETDTFVRGNEEIRGIINSGFDKETATVTRVVPVNGNGSLGVADFSTWCPQLLAGIGDLADTIQDRSVSITMVRKLKSQTVPKLRARDAGPLRDLAGEAARWAQDNMQAVAEIVAAGPEGMPDELNDRATDAWEILFAIAQQVGDPWPAYTHQAALALTAGAEDTSRSVVLLRDLRELFDERGVDTLFSSEIVKTLREREDRSYDRFKDRRPLTVSALADVLGGYRVPTNKDVRRGTEKRKGYKRDWLEDAFERYL